MALITKHYTFASGANAYAEHVNANFDQLYAEVNGNLNLANLRAEQFIWSVRFHHVGLCPPQTGTARSFVFTWPTITQEGGATVELTITELGVAFSNTTGGAAASGFCRAQIYEWDGAAWDHMGFTPTAEEKFTPAADSSAGAGYTTLHAGKTYKIDLQSSNELDESNAHDIDVWLEGKASLFGRHTG